MAQLFDENVVVSECACVLHLAFGIKLPYRYLSVTGC